MQTNYAPFTDRMINKYEGPYCWNKGDPGGPTKYGITCFDLAEHRGQKMNSMADWAPTVRAMSLSEAEDIYAVKYARRLRFNDLGAGKDCVVEDYGVNSGILRPIHVARALLKLPAGSVMDDDLVKAINAADTKWFINAMCDERLHFMHQIRGGSAWQEFGKGWGARVADLRTYGLNVAANMPTQPAPDLSTVPTPKAQHPVPQVTPAHVAKSTVAGTVGGAASHGAGMHWYVTAGIVASVVAVGVGAVLWQQHRANVANRTVVLPPNVVPQGA